MISIKVTSLDLVVDGTVIPFGFTLKNVDLKETSYWTNRNLLGKQILRSEGFSFERNYVSSSRNGDFVHAVDEESLERGDYFARLPEKRVPSVLKQLSIVPITLSDFLAQFHRTLEDYHSLEFVSRLSFGRVLGSYSGYGLIGINIYVVPESTIEIDLPEK